MPTGKCDGKKIERKPSQRHAPRQGKLQHVQPHHQGSVAACAESEHAEKSAELKSQTHITLIRIDARKEGEANVRVRLFHCEGYVGMVCNTFNNSSGASITRS